LPDFKRKVIVLICKIEDVFDTTGKVRAVADVIIH